MSDETWDKIELAGYVGICLFTVVFVTSPLWLSWLGLPLY